MNSNSEALLSLATEAESAGPERQRELLELAFALLFPQHYMPGRSGIGPSRWSRFNQMLDAEAFVDAALMLKKPEHSILMAASPSAAVADIHTKPLGEESCWLGQGKSSTLSLAILSAICRAAAAGEG